MMEINGFFLTQLLWIIFASGEKVIPIWYHLDNHPHYHWLTHLQDDNAHRPWFPLHRMGHSHRLHHLNQFRFNYCKWMLLPLGHFGQGHEYGWSHYLEWVVVYSSFNLLSCQYRGYKNNTLPDPFLLEKKPGLQLYVQSQCSCHGNHRFVHTPQTVACSACCSQSLTLW